MEQKNMSMSAFMNVLDSAPEGLEVVSLQGEGEPLLNKDIWRMAREVKERSIETYTITNASYSLTDRFYRLIDNHFDRIGISLDTVNRPFADRIGRFGLNKTMSTIEKLVDRLGPDRVDIYSVALTKKSLSEVRRYVNRLKGVRHIIQPLQRKSDYQINYTIESLPGNYSYQCRYISNDIMRFFNIDGIEMPCCYIKNVSNFISIADIRARLADKVVPECCAGCREIVLQEAPLNRTKSDSG